MTKSSKGKRGNAYRINYCLNYTARPQNAFKELDTRAVVIFVALLLIISATVCVLYKDVVLDVPQTELRYNFSDLIK